MAKLIYLMQKIENCAVAFAVLEQSVWSPSCRPEYCDPEYRISVVCGPAPSIGDMSNDIHIRARRADGRDQGRVSVKNFASQAHRDEWVEHAHKALQGWADWSADWSNAFESRDGTGGIFERRNVIKCRLDRFSMRTAVFQVYEQSGVKSTPSEFKSSVGIRVSVQRAPYIDLETIHLRGCEPTCDDNVSVINFPTCSECNDWLRRANVALAEWAVQFKQKGTDEQGIYEV